jgi:hypothetical protein
MVSLNQSLRLDRKFIQPAVLSGFIIAIFERDRFFDDRAVQDMTKGFVKAARDFGRRQQPILLNAN